MAEFVMKDLVKKAHRDDDFYIESAATSTEEIGNPVYPPARRKLVENDIRCDGHAARQVRRSDYNRFDLIVCMDHWNIRNISRIIPDDPEGKICLLMEFVETSSQGGIPDVADPWYTGDFEATYRDVVAGCKELLKL